MKKNVLCLFYSNSGQTELIVNHVLEPLRASGEVELSVRRLMPRTPFPFPWSFLSFFGAFPEAVREVPCEMDDVVLPDGERFDVVVLAYPVWFMSVATPVVSFLKGAQAALLKNTNVVTIVTCRSMWSQAQLSMQRHLSRLGARLVGHVTFRDRSGNKPITWVSTPLWLISGKKKVSRYIPEAGVAPETIKSAGRFGQAILATLALATEDGSEPLGQADLLTTTVTSEMVGKNIFRVWALIIGACSKPGSLTRRVLICPFVLCLFGIAMTFLPAWVLLVRLAQVTGIVSPTRQVVRFASAGESRAGG